MIFFYFHPRTYYLEESLSSFKFKQPREERKYLQESLDTKN